MYFGTYREDLVVIHIRELLLVAYGHDSAFAFADGYAVGSLDVEVIAGE